MTEVAIGVKETSEVVSYFLHLIKVGTEILEDGKVSLGDAGSLLSLLDGLNDAISSAGEMPEELKDLDLDELESLTQLVTANYDTDNKKAKEIIEKALKALKANYEVYLLVRG